MRKSLIFAFGFIGQIGFATAIPLVGLGLLGRFLDRKFETGPYLFLSSLVVATVIVYFVLRQIVKRAIIDFDKDTNTKKQ